MRSAEQGIYENCDLNAQARAVPHVVLCTRLRVLNLNYDLRNDLDLIGNYDLVSLYISPQQLACKLKSKSRKEHFFTI